MFTVNDPTTQKYSAKVMIKYDQLKLKGIKIRKAAIKDVLNSIIPLDFGPTFNFKVSQSFSLKQTF